MAVETVMKTKIALKHCMAASLLLFCSMLQPWSALASGPLTPPGAPAPMWKTLQEIEPRTLISSVPFTISAPGSYYLSNNLTVVTGNAITIAANGVTLDLNGFTLSSTVAPASGYGIYISSSWKDIAILNGHVQGGVTDNGSGTFTGSGFGYGVYGPSAANVRVSGVSVSGVLYYGIYLNSSGSTVVEECTVNTVGSYGIYANVVESCSAYGCLRITKIQRGNISDPNYVLLVWAAQPTRFYGVQRRTTLTPETTWMEFFTSSWPDVTSIGFDNTGDQWFYRVRAFRPLMP